MLDYDFRVSSIRFSDVNTNTNADVWLYALKLNGEEIRPQYCFMDLPPFYMEKESPFYNPTWEEKVYKFHHPMINSSEIFPETKRLYQIYFRGALDKAKEELIKRYEVHRVLPNLEALFQK